MLAIGNYAFADCRALAHVTIGDGVSDIGTSAFAGCVSLAELYIPPSVTAIGNELFKHCRPQLVICCAPNSPAHLYATAHGIPFRCR